MPKTEMRMGRDLVLGDRVEGDGGYYVVEPSPAAKSGMCLNRTPIDDFTHICSVMNDLPYPVLIKRTTEDRVRDGVDAYCRGHIPAPDGIIQAVMAELNADD